MIIPAYNAESSIATTIQSCLDQVRQPLEIIVIDDGSIDRTAEVVAKFPEPVRLIRKPNGGPASARNAGARVARGEWLAMLDADDNWLESKLLRQLIYDTSPSIGIIHCLADTSRKGVPSVLSFDDLWHQNWIINSSVLIRRSVFNQVGGFEEDRRLISVEDYHLWLRVAYAKWTIVTCPETLVRYTRGVGISSHTEKFFQASLANIKHLGETLGLPRAKTRQKLAQIHTTFGDGALFARNMTFARRAYKQAVQTSPSLHNIARFLISQLPRSVLDFRRRSLMGWKSAKPAPNKV